MSDAPPSAHAMATRTRVGVFVLALLGVATVCWTGAGHRLPVIPAVVIGVLTAALALSVVVVNQRPAPSVKSRDSPASTDLGPKAGGEGVDSAPVADMFLPLAGRLEVLLLLLIQEIDTLEHEIEDPEFLNALFRADHLSVQALRLSETLTVLGEQSVHRSAREAVPLRALVRAAISEIRLYTLVEISRIDDVYIDPAVHGDLRHLLAELLDNATYVSDPDGEQASIRALIIPAGLKITITDHGLAPNPDKLGHFNAVLAGSVRVGEVLAHGQYGLAAVGMVAARHGLHVSLAPNQYGGTDAVVVVPRHLLLIEQATPDRASPPAPASKAPASDTPWPRELTGELPTGPRPGLPQRHCPSVPETPAETTLPQIRSTPPGPGVEGQGKPPLPQRVPRQPAHSANTFRATESRSAAFDPVSVGEASDVLTGRAPQPTHQSSDHFAFPQHTPPRHRE